MILDNIKSYTYRKYNHVFSSYSQIFKYIYINTYNKPKANIIVIPEPIEPVIIEVIKVIPYEVSYRVEEILYTYIKMNI